MILTASESGAMYLLIMTLRLDRDADADCLREWGDVNAFDSESGSVASECRELLMLLTLRVGPDSDGLREWGDVDALTPRVGGVSDGLRECGDVDAFDSESGS